MMKRGKKADVSRPFLLGFVAIALRRHGPDFGWKMAVVSEFKCGMWGQGLA